MKTSTVRYFLINIWWFFFFLFFSSFSFVPKRRFFIQVQTEVFSREKNQFISLSRRNQWILFLCATSTGFFLSLSFLLVFFSFSYLVLSQFFSLCLTLNSNFSQKRYAHTHTQQCSKENKPFKYFISHSIRVELRWTFNIIIYYHYYPGKCSLPFN